MHPVITEDTEVETIMASVPGAAAIIARHGCVVADECPAGGMDLPLIVAEAICDLRDLPGLIDELNAALVG
jgi:hypothetical protein